MPAATSQWKHKLAFSEHYNRDIQVYSPKSLMIKFFKDIFVNSQPLKCFRYYSIQNLHAYHDMLKFTCKLIYFLAEQNTETQTHTATYAQQHALTYTYLHTKNIRTHTHIHIYTCALSHTYACTHACMHTRMYGPGIGPST